MAAEITLSDQLRQLPPPVRSTMQALRRSVRAIAPSAEEITYQSQPPRSKSAMWKIVRYAVDGVNVIGFGTVSGHVDLFFYRGTDLHDNDGVLKGSGKGMRFVPLEKPADAERRQVQSLLRQAFELAQKG